MASNRSACGCNRGSHSGHGLWPVLSSRSDRALLLAINVLASQSRPVEACRSFHLCRLSAFPPASCCPFRCFPQHERGEMDEGELAAPAPRLREETEEPDEVETPDELRRAAAAARDEIERPADTHRDRDA